MRVHNGIVLVLVLVLGLVLASDAYSGEPVDRCRHGGYYGTVLKAGPVSGKAGLYWGAKGAWLINHNISVGGGKYWLFEVKTDEISADGKPLYLDMSYGGFEFGYIHNYRKKVHWAFHAMFGGGTISLREHNPTIEVESDVFYMVEPGVGVNINLLPWIQIGISASYLFPIDVELEQIKSPRISGPTAMISLRLGLF